ncbi:SCO family protein [Cytobacillus suaedae]|nr:SCO family protein [Cytobacillus suaedae]
MKKVFIILLLIIITMACSTSKEEIEQSFPMALEVQEFEAVGQDGETVSLADLKGKVWVASTIFTNCDTVCSPMTANMAKLQQKLNEENVEATLVSFSIDPERDTADVLRDFANVYDADFSYWHFLSGYSQEEIETFINKSFMSPAAQLEGSDQFMHSTSIFLVSESGTVVQQYSGVSDVPYEQIVEDIKKLN